MKSARVECESRRRPRRRQNRPSEAVVFTTVAVVYRLRQPCSIVFKPRLSAKVTPSHPWGPQTDGSDGNSSLTEWQPVTNGAAWAQIHVFMEMKRDDKRDSALGNFRIVAWVLETGRVVLNDSLGGNCHWGEVEGWQGDAAVFRQLLGVDGQVLGFRFCTAEQADECSRFLSRVILGAEGVRVEMNMLLDVGGGGSLQSQSGDNQGVEDDGRPGISTDRPAEGDLDCNDHAVASVSDEKTARKIENRISCPYKTRQELHVTYNVELARYEGLPVAWRALNVQFGLPLEGVPKRAVDGYEAKIPAVLHMLKEYLVTTGGLRVEGIFRLAPDREECAEVKRAINNGTFSGCEDVNVVANLIKVWFRELPRGVFNMVPEQTIYAVCELKDDERVLESVGVLPPLHRSLVLWLLDLMVEVVRHEMSNKMSAKNLAIVMTPNLLRVASENPMVALTKSQKAAEYTLALLNARLRQSPQL